jgi:hypothetical protein
MGSEKLTKVHVDLPNHWAVAGESLWACPLGDDTYELRNVPFHAYDLNYLDVVQAVPSSPDRKPTVLRVVRRSGHRTLRVVFARSVPDTDRMPRLESLRTLGASVEGANRNYFAIDIEPSGDYAAIRARLDEWEAQELLEYETCDARVQGSFDDKPSSGAPESG